MTSITKKNIAKPAKNRWLINVFVEILRVKFKHVPTFLFSSLNVHLLTHKIP